MIAGGSALVTEYGWLLYVFAAFLAFTGNKMLFASEKPMDVAGNPVDRWLSRHIPITQELHGEKFFVCVPDTRTDRKSTSLNFSNLCAVRMPALAGTYIEILTRQYVQVPSHVPM